MDADERDLRKRRRRSVRNLRRTSGILPLNLNALEERTDDGSTKASQSEENQQDMFGSMWCESLEPVKKRRRRSNLLVGLVPKVPEPEIEEEAENCGRNNHNVYLTEIQKDQNVKNDLESVLERNNDGEGMDTLNGAVVATQTNSVVLESRTNFIEKQKLDVLKQVEDTDTVNIFENEEIKADNCQNEDNNDLNYEIDKCEEENNIGRTSLNRSDLSNRSAHDCNLSKVSPSSMSPDFPISPSTSLYHEPQEESYIGVNGADTETVNDTEMTHSFENENDLSQSSNRESIKKSSGADQLSDLSHSDKENSMVNDNVSLNITPVVKDDSAEKVSPGFMSLCKAFAGKVVNFVRTSPSYLTGGILDSSHTVDVVCASPALKGNTSLNLASNELSMLGAQSDVNKSLEKLGAEINKERSCFTSAEIDTNVGDLVDNNNIESENIVDHFDKTVEKPLSTNKSMSQGVCGSAKKQRDRKTFFDTFNAVSDELKKARRKSACIEDTKEMIVDETNTSDLGRVTVEHTETPIEQTGKGTAESNPNIAIDHSEVIMKSSSSDRVIDGDIANGKVSTDGVPNKDIAYIHDICTDSNAQNEKSVNASPLSIEKQTFESASKESLTENAVTEKSVNINVEEAFECVVDKNALDNEFAGDAGSVCMELDYNVTSSRAVSEDRCNKTGSESESLIGTKVTVKSREDNTSEKLHHSVCNTMQVSENSPVKDIQKRRKRRALDIPNVDYNEIASSTDSGKDQDIDYYEELCEKKQKLISETDDEELIGKTSEKLTNTVSRHPEASENIDSLCLLGDQIYSDDKQVHKVSTLWKGKKDEHKTRKNRRKSFGVLSVCETNEENPYSVKNSETDIHTSVTGNTTTEGNEVDHINETDSAECHIEERVAALDLGNENIQDVKDYTERHIRTDVLLGFEHSDKSTVQIENKEMTLESNLEKKKRGRPRRKSANLNDILKRGRGRPRKEICEQVLEEANESGSNSERSEVNNISELTNEISQVQINDSDKQVKPVQAEISVENLVLPGDDLGTPEHKSETKRRRRRSAEAATLRLQMINEDKSPSTTDTVKTSQSKRGKRKSADAAALKIQQMDLSEDSACPEGDSSPDQDTTATKRGRKRKHKEDTVEELEKLYRNKNFVKPEERKPWQTVLECPGNSLEIFGKKRLQRHIEFERPSQLKLRRRLQKAVKNGWDPKKRKRSELDDNFVQVRLMNLWSELDEEEEGSNSLQSKLRDIVETT